MSILLACCNRDSLACAIHTLIQNLLSLGAAIVVIYYDTVFIAYPYICLLTFTSNCYSSGGIDSIISGATSYSTKTLLNKVQIGCAAGMLTTNVVYVIIFVVVTVRVSCFGGGGGANGPVSASVGPPVQQDFGLPAQPAAAAAYQQPALKSPMPAYPMALHPAGLQLPTYIAQCPHCYGLMRVG